MTDSYCSWYNRGEGVKERCDCSGTYHKGSVEVKLSIGRHLTLFLDVLVFEKPGGPLPCVGNRRSSDQSGNSGQKITTLKTQLRRRCLLFDLDQRADEGHRRGEGENEKEETHCCKDDECVKL
jgi:hypothetical protein